MLILADRLILGVTRPEDNLISYYLSGPGLSYIYSTDRIWKEGYIRMRRPYQLSGWTKNSSSYNSVCHQYVCVSVSSACLSLCVVSLSGPLRQPGVLPGRPDASPPVLCGAVCRRLSGRHGVAVRRVSRRLLQRQLSRRLLRKHLQGESPRRRR